QQMPQELRDQPQLPHDARLPSIARAEFAERYAADRHAGDTKWQRDLRSLPRFLHKTLVVRGFRGHTHALRPYYLAPLDHAHPDPGRDVHRDRAVADGRNSGAVPSMRDAAAEVNYRRAIEVERETNLAEPPLHFAIYLVGGYMSHCRECMRQYGFKLFSL